MNITVIGSGTMGNGIAHVMAQYGHAVILNDLLQENLSKALEKISQNLDRQISKGILTVDQKSKILSAITTTTDLKDAVKTSDLIIEAAVENESVKQEIFRKLDQYSPAHCILATNTSSISITKIASVTKRADKVIGMHFMNPVPVMKLVEVIRGRATSDEVCKKIMELSVSLEKIPVEVNDAPGFISNRLLMPYINEAIYALHEGVSGVKEIDEVMKLGMAHPMGPLQLADFIGLDVCLFILKVIQEGFNSDKYTPCPLLVEMVNAGQKGIKTGSGFYKYTAGSKELIVADRFK